MNTHKIFGAKENAEYRDRKGAYVIPIKNDRVGIIQTPKGFFLLGGGLKDKETDEMCVKRECLEETGYTVSVNCKVCSAESYYLSPEIGYFHPIQTYYIGELLEKKQISVEKDHKLVWFKYEDLKGKLFLEMQNWALEQSWKLYLQQGI